MAEEVLSGTDNFTSWKQRLDTQMNTIRSEGVAGGVPTDEEQRTMQNATRDAQVISDCIAKKTKCIADLGTTIAGSHESILTLKELIQTEKAGLQITKERLSYVRAPDQSTSFYQSWFPLDRPLKLISIPILLGFVFFFYGIIGHTPLAVWRESRPLYSRNGAENRLHNRYLLGRV